MLDATALALKIHDALGQKTDGNGAPTKVSKETQEYASGIVAALKAAIFNHLPGTVNGITAPGSPLSLGSAVGGVVVIQPTPMIAKTSNGFAPPGPQLIAENTAVIQYIGTGLVSFAAGSITGTCTNTPVTPGPLILGAGSMGTLVGLTGAGCTAAVIAAIGVGGPDMLKHYTALIDYVLANAEGSYATESVIGTCPTAGGPLTLGAGTGGTFS